MDSNNTDWGRVSEVIRCAIASGAYLPGTPLPPASWWAREEQVSTGTATHALRELADQGVIVRVPGRGWKVPEGAPDVGGKLTSSELGATGVAVSGKPAKAGPGRPSSAHQTLPVRLLKLVADLDAGRALPVRAELAELLEVVPSEVDDALKALEGRGDIRRSRGRWIALPQGRLGVQRWVTRVQGRRWLFHLPPGSPGVHGWQGAHFVVATTRRREVAVFRASAQGVLRQDGVSVSKSERDVQAVSLGRYPAIEGAVVRAEQRKSLGVVRAVDLPGAPTSSVGPGGPIHVAGPAEGGWLAHWQSEESDGFVVVVRRDGETLEIVATDRRGSLRSPSTSLLLAQDEAQLVEVDGGGFPVIAAAVHRYVLSR